MGKKEGIGFLHNIIGKSNSTIFPLNVVIRSIFHILWNCSYVYVFIFERGLSARYKMSSHNDTGSGCLVSLKDRVTDNRCPSYCFDQPNGCMEANPHQNNPSAISEAWAWGISSFLPWSNALSSLDSPLILSGGLLEFGDTQYSARKKSELTTQVGSQRICIEGEVGSRILDWDGRCSVHDPFLEAWVFFLNVDRKRTSETKRKRSQASEASSNILMPCWLEYMLIFFSSNTRLP